MWPRLPRSLSTVVLLLAVVVLPPVSDSPRSHHFLSPLIPPSPALLPCYSIGPLRPLALSRAPLPLALAANIATRDEDVGNRTGGVVARWLMAGRYTPCRESPHRPLDVVGDSIIRPRFLHRPQKYHPVHCRPAVRHSQAQADGNAVDQVECWVQLQHRSTSFWTRLPVGQLTVEPVLNSPVGAYPLRFRPPDGPAAVKYLGTLPSIARPYLLRLEIAAGLSHRELTLLTHNRRPLTCRRPHLHRGVCVCVCVCV